MKTCGLSLSTSVNNVGGGLSSAGILLIIVRSANVRPIMGSSDLANTVEKGAALHSGPAKDRSNLQNRLGIVGRVENGEFMGKHREEHDPGRPDVNR